MSPDIAIFVLLPATIYALSLLHLRGGLKRRPEGKNRDALKVSVVIAARNEEDNIEACLRSVLAQSLATILYEVIVVDDRSEDRTAEIVLAWAKKHPNLRLVQIFDKETVTAPKKRAIERGISHANGEIIVTTDADCTPGPKWLAGLLSHFEPGIGMVCGFNPYEIRSGHANIFQKMLALDYFSMAAIAAATADLGFPMSCTAGNLAYRKCVFDELGGFGKTSEQVSGDDDLFLQRVREETNWGIRYITARETFVPTTPPKSLREFLRQRIRYASKGFAYSPKVIVALMGIFLLNAMLAVCILATPLLPTLAATTVIMMTSKALAEFSFLQKAAQVFQTSFSLTAFIIASLLHPFYITFVAIAAQFADIHWKSAGGT